MNLSRRLKKPLTDRQKAILTAIAAYHTLHGFPPALRDIADQLDMSMSGVNYLVGKLERGAYLTRYPNIARSITLTDAGRAVAGEGVKS